MSLILDTDPVAVEAAITQLRIDASEARFRATILAANLCASEKREASLQQRLATAEERITLLRGRTARRRHLLRMLAGR